MTIEEFIEKFAFAIEAEPDTLAADTNNGTRASFTPAAAPELAQELYNQWVASAKVLHKIVETGIFAADMQVSLVNDGPVTFWLKVSPEI